MLGPSRVLKASPTGEKARTTCTFACEHLQNVRFQYGLHILEWCKQACWYKWLQNIGTNQPRKLSRFRILTSSSVWQLLAVESTILGLHPGQVGAEDVGFGRWNASLLKQNREIKNSIIPSPTKNCVSFSIKTVSKPKLYLLWCCKRVMTCNHFCKSTLTCACWHAARQACMMESMSSQLLRKQQKSSSKLNHWVCGASECTMP